jgi:hypothetical protein
MAATEHEKPLEKSLNQLYRDYVKANRMHIKLTNKAF